MTQRSRLLLSLVVLALLVAPAAAQEAKPADKQKLSDKLARKITLDKFEGNFKEAVELFATKFDLSLVVDPSVGANAGMAACDAADALPVRLPKLVNVRADTALRILCEQVGAMYMVQPDHIRIVAAAAGLLESGVIKPAEPGEEPDPVQFTPLDQQKYKPLIKRALVTAAFKGVALSDVLDDIAESTGATVVLSPDVGPMGDRKVTARFANTPVEAAIRTLCEITDLGVIEDANVLVVTTKEKAAVRTKADEEKRKARSAAFTGIGGLCGTPFALGGLAGGGGVGLTGFGAPADLSVEVVRLKEQNEQLKKQLDELQKAIKK